MGVEVMEKIDIDVVGTQSTQTPLDGSDDMASGTSAGIRVVAPFTPHLGSDNDMISFAFDKSAQNALRFTHGINVRAVEEIDSGFPAGSINRARHRLIRFAAECHCTQAER